MKSKSFLNFASAYCLKIFDEKNTPLSKVLIFHERNFHQEVTFNWSLKMKSEVAFHFKNICLIIYIGYPCSWDHQKTFGQTYFCCKFQLFTLSRPSSTPEGSLRGNLITVIWSLKHTIFWELFFQGSVPVPSKRWIVV